MYTLTQFFSFIVQLSVPFFLYCGTILIISSTIIHYYSALVNQETQLLKNETAKLKAARHLRRNRTLYNI